MIYTVDLTISISQPSLVWRAAETRCGGAFSKPLYHADQRETGGFSALCVFFANAACRGSEPKTRAHSEEELLQSADVFLKPPNQIRPLAPSQMPWASNSHSEREDFSNLGWKHSTHRTSLVRKPHCAQSELHRAHTRLDKSNYYFSVISLPALVRL